MRVLLFIETLRPGGAELFVVRLANRLSENYETGIVVFYEDLVHVSLSEKLHPSVKVYLIKIPFSRMIQRVDGLLRKLGIDVSMIHRKIVKQSTRIVEEFTPDVVHGHLFKTDWVISQIKQKYAFRQVTTVHGDYSSFYFGEGDSQLLDVKNKIRTTIKEVDSIVCLSEEHMFFFKQHFPEVISKLRLIYNGYEPLNKSYVHKKRSDLGLPATGFLFGMVSRGVEQKGWQKAIDAFLNASLPDAYLILAGKGDHLDKLAEDNEYSNIIFVGYISQPLEYVQHFDVCLLPSLFQYESLPTVIIEYLYCGKPVIATEVGEMRKMMTDNVSASLGGDLLSFKDCNIDIKEFSALMTVYYQEPSYRQKKAKIAGRAFEKFDMQKCLTAYREVYSHRQ